MNEESTNLTQDETLQYLLSIHYDINKLFNSDIGQNVLEYLKKKASIGETIFRESHAEMAFLSGQQRMVQTIIDYLAMKPEELKNRYIKQQATEKENGRYITHPK